MTHDEFKQKWTAQNILVIAGISEEVDEWYVMLDDVDSLIRQEFWDDYWTVWGQPPIFLLSNG